MKEVRINKRKQNNEKKREQNKTKQKKERKKRKKERKKEKKKINKFFITLHPLRNPFFSFRKMANPPDPRGSAL